MKREIARLKKKGERETGIPCSYLLEAGDRVHELNIQFGVVLSQGLVSVVTDELHHRAEGKRI